LKDIKALSSESLAIRFPLHLVRLAMYYLPRWKGNENYKDESWPIPIKVPMGIHTGSARAINYAQWISYEGYGTLALTRRIMFPWDMTPKSCFRKSHMIW
jgi:hypothetical protein